MYHTLVNLAHWLKMSENLDPVSQTDVNDALVHFRGENDLDSESENKILVCNFAKEASRKSETGSQST